MVVAAMVLVAGPASATWSIVAVDPETGRVGAVLASCVPSGVLGDPEDVLVPVVLVPGRAAAIAQGTIDPDGPDGLRQLLVDGATPEEAIDAMLETDDQPTVRQFGIVVLSGDGSSTGAATALGFTGADTELERGHVTNQEASVQGVLLADARLLDATLAAYGEARADGASLEQALVAGLSAGSRAGGDRRCGDQTALFAHLAVAEPGDDPQQPSTLLTVTVDEGDGQNPVPLLAEALDEGRRGWIDLGLDDPAGIPRFAVLIVATLLSVAAFFTIRRGLGSPSARR